MTSQRNQSSLQLLLTLIAGIVLGFSLSQLLHNSNCLLDLQLSIRERSEPSIKTSTSTDDDPYTSYALNSQMTSSMYHKDGGNRSTELADRLYNETRILCWVLTSPENHEKRAIHVKNTWGSRCNLLLFMSTKEDKKLGAVKLSVGEGRGSLWQKTREALKYIYENHIDDADWFFKADDDTYVIPENLRMFLYQYSTDEPVYFGCKFKPHVRQGYMSGGAGYALSKEALRRFVEKAYPNEKLCRQRRGGSEDMELGYCLQNVGIVAGDSRDDFQRGRFFPSGPQGHLIPKDKTHWYWRYIFYKTKDGLDCCSDYAISFHYIHYTHFYVMDYLIYKLRPFGVFGQTESLPKKLNMSELLIRWRNETSDNPL